MPRMIDPPSGWMYGFPKIIPDSVKNEDVNEWLVANGYPRHEITSLGRHFWCRFWSSTETEEESTNV